MGIETKGDCVQRHSTSGNMNTRKLYIETDTSVLIKNVQCLLAFIFNWKGFKWIWLRKSF